MTAQRVAPSRNTLARASGRDRSTALRAAALFAAVLAIYSANGREIGSYDSQPTKFAAIELVRYRTLTVDRMVLRAPGTAERPGFAVDREGHYRSAYPVLPAVVAAGVASVLRLAGLVDLGAPMAPSLVAKLTASLLTALAVVAAFFIARRRLDTAQALLVALGFGLGTNLWAVTSQTLWQSETAVAALSAAVLCLAVPAETLTATRLWTGALLLGLAAAARPQLAPAVAILALSIAVRRRRARDLVALTPLLAVTGTVIALNIHWFGHVLGAVPRVEALHPVVHAVGGTIGNPLAGAAGLLVSPSRGLLVFSPIVAVALFALPTLVKESWRDDLRWWGCAAVAQLAVYASYSVWWGGHTYGPRYGLDILPLLLPLAAAGLPWIAARRPGQWLATTALAWSVAVAATGAFVYPNEQWNTDPAEIDTNHERLWDWHDPQIVRCWKAGWSPQNFSLFTTEAVRRSRTQAR